MKLFSVASIQLFLLCSLLLVGSPLFSQRFELDEVVVKDAASGEMLKILDSKSLIYESVVIKVKKNRVVLALYTNKGELHSEEVIIIEQDYYDENGRVIKGKGIQDGRYTIISFNNNNSLFIEYGLSYKMEDIEFGMYFKSEMR